MTKDELIENIRRYRHSESRLAIMLNAPWGSGKTFFVKECIEKERRIYVSLYGLKNRTQIFDEIFEAIIGIDDFSEKDVGKASSMLTKIIQALDTDKNVSAGAIGVVATAATEAFKKRVIKNISEQKVLVFDDLERYKGEMEEALSCINEFTEHRGVKTIIICDERKINDPNYKSTKEKTVSFTYSISLDDKEKAEIAINSVSLPKEIDKERIYSALVTVIKVLKAVNLRTIVFATECFCTLMQTLIRIGHDLKDRNVYLIMHTCLVIAVGFREKGFDKLRLLDLASIMRLKVANQDQELIGFQASFSGLIELFAVSSTCEIVCSGNLSESQISSDFGKIPDYQHRTAYTIYDQEFEVMDADVYAEKMQAEIEKMQSPDCVFAGINEIFLRAKIIHEQVSKGSYEYDIEALKNAVTYCIIRHIKSDHERDLYYDLSANSDPFISDIEKAIRPIIESESLRKESHTSSNLWKRFFAESDKTSLKAVTLDLTEAKLKIFFEEQIDYLVDNIGKCDPMHLYYMELLIRWRYQKKASPHRESEQKCLDRLLCKLKIVEKEMQPSLKKHNLNNIANAISARAQG